jgi:hypothetical protein
MERGGFLFPLCLLLGLACTLYSDLYLIYLSFITYPLFRGAFVGVVPNQGFYKPRSEDHKYQNLDLAHIELRHTLAQA